MSDKPNTPDEQKLTDEEIAAQEGEQLPNREVMSVLTLSPDQPVIGDWEPPPHMQAGNAIEPPPPTS